MALPQSNVEQFKYAEMQPAPNKDADGSLESRLLAKAKEYYALTKASREHRYPLWLLVANFAKGREYFLFHKHFHTTVDINPKLAEECMYTPSGLLQHAVETIAAQYGASNGHVVPMPADSTDPKMKAVMRGLRDYADHLVWKFYQRDPAERQIECKLIPQRGVYNLIEWDQEKGQSITLPQYEGQEKRVCQDCGYEVSNDTSDIDSSLGADNSSGGYDGIPVGEQREPISSAFNGSFSQPGASGGSIEQGQAAASTVCPHCGSPNIQTITAGLNNKGNVTRRVGEPVKRIYDPYQVEVYDRNRGIEESPYLFCDDVLFKTGIKKLCPHLKDVRGLASFGNYIDGYIGLHYLQQLQCLIGNSGNLNQVGDEYFDTSGRGTWSVGWEGSFLNPLLCWRRRVWFDVEVYADWQIGIDKPVQLPGRNEWIPPETKVKDIFPDGLEFWIVNGDCVVLTRNQNKNDVWSFVGYRMPSEGLHGSGVTSLVSLTRGYNAANSYALQALLMASLGILVVDERIPKPRNVPGAMLRVPQSARLAGETIASLAARLEMGGGNAIAAAEPVKQGFLGRVNAMTMAATPQGDAQTRPEGVGGGTATAVRYESGIVSTLVNPPLELYGAQQVKVVEQGVRMTKQRSIRPPQFGKFGDTVMKSFDLMSVPEDVAFGQAEGSYRMKTIETEREDLFAFANVLPAIAGNEPLMSKALQVFGLADEVDDATDWEIIADKRLDRLKALAEEFEVAYQQAQAEMVTAQATTGAPEAMVAVQQMQAQQAVTDLPLQFITAADAMPKPIDAKGHGTFIKFWENTYQSDKFEEYPSILQEAVYRLWALHQEGVGQAGAIATEQEVAATEPAREAQKRDAMEQSEQQAMLEQDGGEDEQAAKEGDFARQTALTDRQHEQAKDVESSKHRHNKEMENLKAKNVRELEKVRAKNKPKGK